MKIHSNGSIHFYFNAISPKSLLNFYLYSIILEFIPGKEVSVMVFETRDGLMALSPIQYDLGDEEFLHFDKKFGQPNYKILRNDSPLSEKIKEAGITAFDCLGVRGSSYARVDFRVSKEGSLYLLEVNQVPAFFSPPGMIFY